MDDDVNICDFLESHVDSFDVNQDHPDIAPVSINCKYCTENEFAEGVNNRNSNRLSLLHFNVRSMHANFDNLSIFVDSFRSHHPIIGVSETWLSSEQDKNIFSLPGYNFITNNRHGKRGGGVGLYIPSQLEFQVRQELSVMTDNLETLFVQVFLPERRNIVVGIIYRPPQGNLGLVTDDLHDLLSVPFLNNKSVFLMGDFNVNLLQCESNNQFHDFLNLLLSFSLMPLITKPTRVTDTSCTLIDNIFCNVQPFPDSGIIVSDISDHFPVYARIDLDNKSCNVVNEKYVRKSNPANIAKFRDGQVQAI